MPNDSNELVGIEHEGIVCDLEANNAVLFTVQGQEMWLPRSQLDSYDEDELIIPRWLADDRDLEPDWDV